MVSAAEASGDRDDGERQQHDRERVRVGRSVHRGRAAKRTSMPGGDRVWCAPGGQVFRFSALLLVSGCPYVFSEPDFGNVDDPSGDPFVQDSAPDPVGGEGAPSVTSFSVTPRLDGAIVSFSASDAEGDLVGGSVVVTDGTETWTLSIPDDLDRWNPDGVSKATLPLGAWIGCDSPDVDRTFSLVPIDFAGNEGAPRDASFHITTVGTLPENGNRWPQDAHRLDVSPPFMGCVTFEADPDEPGSVREQLFGDVEAMFFVTPLAGAYRVALTWAPAADMDIFVLSDPLLDADGDEIPDVTCESTTYSMPEQTVLSARAGDSWLFDPTFFDLLPGGDPPFDAFFLISPE